MATVKLKFRPSSVDGKEGSLYYQVIHNRIVRKIGTAYKLSREEWNHGQLQCTAVENSDERNLYLADLKDRLQKDILRLKAIIRRLEQSGHPYTTEQIVNAYWASGDDECRLGEYVRILVRQLKSQGKDRLSETYATSLNSFLRFRGEKGDVWLEEMDAEMLQAYEAYLQGCGLVPNTTSFYMRNLRAIYNRAVRKGLVADRLPFRQVYTGVEKTAKRAVSSKVIRRIRNLDLSGNAALAQSRDLFMFSFYTRGMSFVDMARLKKKDLKNGVLTYRRQKTDQRLLIRWEQPMQDIVDKYQDSLSPYLLPIITRPGSNERRQYLNAIRLLNAHLKEIGRRVKSPVPLTSYVARHGWASIARNQHIPLTVISAAMGHDSENTTRIYLDAMDSSAVDKANSKVIRAVL